MNLKEYLLSIGEKPTPWAKKHGIPPSVISKFINNKSGLSLKMALRIAELTENRFRPEDLVGD
jgi:plasmid maintenance system antidote protein VapI